MELKTPMQRKKLVDIICKMISNGECRKAAILLEEYLVAIGCREVNKYVGRYKVC